VDKSKMEVVWDYDYMKYSIGAVCETRTIKVTHPEGLEKEFSTRTEFWGHYLKKENGWLKEYNSKRKIPLLPEEFTVEDIQVPMSVKICKERVDEHIARVLNTLGKTKYYGYVGKGDSWRVQASTILKYKGNRVDTLRPLHLGTIGDYLVESHNAEYVTDLEVDDVVVADCYTNPELILIGIDKDYLGCALTLFNPDKMGEPEKISGFGKLYVGSDKKIRGEGRVFLYHQVLSGDSSDGYKANCASDLKWSDKSSYAVLSKCSTDKQALEAMVESFKKLYPEPKVITGWRGDTFEIDWFYVMQECFTMAHMLRFKGDKFCLKTVLDKQKINY
jgi:hypothetical protein